MKTVQGEHGEGFQRSGPGWDALMAKYRLVAIEDVDKGWTVRSQSGSTYMVRQTWSIGKWDGSLIGKWTCSCPARKRCRHIDAVEAMLYAEARAEADARDSQGLDVLERMISYH